MRADSSGTKSMRLSRSSSYTAQEHSDCSAMPEAPLPNYLSQDIITEQMECSAAIAAAGPPAPPPLLLLLPPLFVLRPPQLATSSCSCRRCSCCCCCRCSCSCCHVHHSWSLPPPPLRPLCRLPVPQAGDRSANLYPHYRPIRAPSPGTPLPGASGRYP